MLSIGSVVRVVNGAHAGNTGVVLRGSFWRASSSCRAGFLYSVHIDGSSNPSAKIWDQDLVPYLNLEKKYA